MRRFRSFLAIFLLFIFAWSRAADALPLVWCLGADGHNAVELANSSGCHSAPKTDLYVDSGYATPLFGKLVGDHHDCTDFTLADELRSPIKVSKTLAPPVPVPSVVEPVQEHRAAWPIRLAVRADPVINQLAQLRTVILRL